MTSDLEATLNLAHLVRLSQATEGVAPRMPVIDGCAVVRPVKSSASGFEEGSFEGGLSILFTK